jgi:hypothetical protein
MPSSLLFHTALYRFFSTLLLLILTGLSPLSLAEGKRADYDLDNDGLIEINDLADLNEIRFGMKSKTLYGSNAGCPQEQSSSQVSGCIGYELTTDLDFDTNKDGIINEQDSFWNPNKHNIGEGWKPIGSRIPNSSEFTFEGNGHVIYNLYINRPSQHYVGLFSDIKKVHIRNLGLSGSLMSVTGGDKTGSLAGAIQDSQITSSFSTGSVYGKRRNTGGLIGFAKSSLISSSFNTGSIEGNGNTGGLVGNLKQSTITNSFNTGAIKHRNSNANGLFGNSKDSQVSRSYTTGNIIGKRSFQSGSYEHNGFVEASLIHLQCVTQDNTHLNRSACATTKVTSENTQSPNSKLFNDWISSTDEEPSTWEFGTAYQLPGLRLNGKVYRDSDGDGTLDEGDQWPNNPAASIDQDKDGQPDHWSPGCNEDCIAKSNLTLDRFLSSNAGGVDNDLDGLPDSWHPDCDAQCQVSSNITLDPYPNDSDNDGINNLIDTDDNNDGIIDADSDSNGLIEIHTLAQLDAIRHQPNGMGRRSSISAKLDDSGCPIYNDLDVTRRRCIGYELSSNLDFDTNQDGLMNELDAFWNPNKKGIGQGWKPIQNFTAVFEGNGHLIRNLFIHRPSNSENGLFSTLKQAEIRNLGMSGPLMSVTGYNQNGSLAGYAHESIFKNVFNIGAISSEQGNAGGLIGRIKASKIYNSFSTGPVTGSEETVGGLIGNASNSQITNSFSTGFVGGASEAGGFLGVDQKDNTITNSYWAIDSSGKKTSENSSAETGYIGVSLAALRCATHANSTRYDIHKSNHRASLEELNKTVSLSLFNGWHQAKNKGQPLWDFGNASQLPALVINGYSYRDSDGDGSLDTDDVWPKQRFASLDKDRDNNPDLWSANCDEACIQASGHEIDQFPTNPAISKDLDLDGLADEWSANCDRNCQIASKITLDKYLNDSDNDGLTNEKDTDDDNDGVTDVDINSNGLIEISSLAQLNAIRYQLDGLGQRLSLDAKLNTSGCPILISREQVQQQCKGYELISDLDFDTNQDGVINNKDKYWNAKFKESGKGWIPIGRRGDITTAYKGILEGNHHVIKNLYIDRPDQHFIGLFGFTKNAEIRNLGLTGHLMSVTGKDKTGGLVGLAYSTQIKNSFNTGFIYGTGMSTGGLLGYGDNSHISDSYNTGHIQSLDINAGGIAGSLRSGSLTNSFNTGSIQSEYSSTGGLLGSTSETKINHCLNAGFVKHHNQTGGLFGRDYESTIINSCYWLKDKRSSEPNRKADNRYIAVSLTDLQCATNDKNNLPANLCSEKNKRLQALQDTLTQLNSWAVEKIPSDIPNAWNGPERPEEKNYNQMLHSEEEDESSFHKWIKKLLKLLKMIASFFKG